MSRSNMRKVKIEEFGKANGTHYQGSVMTSLSNLKRLFGDPSYHYQDIASKTRNEYILESDEGVIATVYDFKEYRAYDDNEIIEFHIGGRSKFAVALIRDIL